MKNLFKKILLSILIGSCSLTFSSCFGFGEEALQINTITTVTLENGDIQVIITYTDEDVKPTTFVVPKGSAGEDGKDGNGIKEITYSQSEDKQNTIVNIAFTQQGVNPVDVIVPNGVSVTGIDQTFDEETQMTTLIVNFSDGTQSEPILIPKGEKGDKGEDGNSILAINHVVNEDKSVTLTIEFTQIEEPVTIEIPAPVNGKDGRGIKDIISLPKGDTYTMIITYSDDTIQELEFARPNKWFSESSYPSNRDGINGDLWFDLVHKTIYVKQNNRWIEVICFDEEIDSTCRIKFNLNDSTESKATMPGSLLTYDIPKGSYFSASGYTIPIPTREGYEFAGWYTVALPTPANGLFTDLTTVLTDINLYAYWIEI